MASRLLLFFSFITCEGSSGRAHASAIRSCKHCGHRCVTTKHSSSQLRPTCSSSAEDVHGGVYLCSSPVTLQRSITADPGGLPTLLREALCTPPSIAVWAAFTNRFASFGCGANQTKILGLPTGEPQRLKQLSHWVMRFEQQHHGGGSVSNGIRTTRLPRQHGSHFMQQHMIPMSTTSSFGIPLARHTASARDVS